MRRSTHIPGPSPLALSWLWRRYGQGLLPTMVAMRGRFGDVCRVRGGRVPNYLISDPAMVQEILVAKAASFTKSPALRAAKATLGEGLLTSEGELHKAHRKALNPAFTATRVGDYAQDMADIARRTVDDWRPGQGIELNGAMTLLTLRVVARTLFGAEVGGDVSRVCDDMGVIVTMFDRVRNPLAPLLNVLPLPSNRRFLAAQARLIETVGAMVERRAAEMRQAEGPGGRRDFLTLLLSTLDRADPRHEDFVRDHAITLFMAGHETTANALVWALILLADHPAEAEKLREDLHRAERADPAERARLPGVRNVLSEAMRLYPPAWIVARQASEEVEVGGWAFPAGSVLLMSQYLIHRDGRFWEAPEAFRPDRWLADEPGVSRPRYAYFPFGGGPRSCVGEAFAWLEAGVLLGEIAGRYRMERADRRAVGMHPTITLRPDRAVEVRLRAWE